VGHRRMALDSRTNSTWKGGAPFLLQVYYEGFRMPGTREDIWSGGVKIWARRGESGTGIKVWERAI